MHKHYFKLKARPFVQPPGEHFFTPNAGVNEVVARLRGLAAARDAVAVISGGPGVGKSALVEHALGGLPGQARVVRVDLRYGEGEDLYAAVAAALDPDLPDLRPARALQALRREMERLGSDERRLVLCLDVAGITVDVARHLLRLVNLAGERHCQMNLVLMGPHAVHQQVDVPALIQLRQRIGCRHRLRPLTLAETEEYIVHQLASVGADAEMVLSRNVAAAVYCYVAGVPRLINTLVDALLGEACLQQVQRPDGSLVKRTAESLGWKPLAPQAAGQPAARVTAPPVRPVATAPPRPAPLPVNGNAARKSELPPPVVAMDATDTGATGMLRLQDLDERFAETIFGQEIEEAAATARRGAD